ncbi:MAG: GyrI-like domain-containing protein [Planctomycetes bacterium]|nr:GyrI-like domain-containing protein [Planctomycetota bacterium]
MRAIALLLVLSVGLGSCARAAAGPAKVRDEARAVLEKAVASMGGDAAVAAVKGMRVASKGTYKMGEMEMPYTATTIYVAPDRLLWKVESPGYQGAVGVDGDTAWSAMMGPPAHAKGAAKDALLEWVVQTKVWLIRPLLSMEGVRISGGRPTKKEGGATRIRIAFPTGRRLTLGFGIDHGKTTLISTQGDTILLDGRKGTMKGTYSTPKAFGPLTLPSVAAAQTFVDGKVEETVREEIVSIEWNPEVPEKAFEMPTPEIALGKAEVKKTDEIQGIMIVHAGPYDAMGKTIGTLQGIAREKGLMVAGPAIAIYANDPGKVKDPSELRTEIVLPVMAMGPIPEDLPGGAAAKTIPSIQVASMAARGPYGDADVAALRRLMTWIPQNGYTIAGAPRILYLHDPDGVIAEDLLAEVQVPVRR